MNMPLKNFEWLLKTLANCSLFHCPLILPFPSSFIFFPGSGIYRCPWTSLSKISFCTWNLELGTLLAYFGLLTVCGTSQEFVPCEVFEALSIPTCFEEFRNLYVWLSNFLGDANLWRCTCFIFILNVFVYIKYK